MHKHFLYLAVAAFALLSLPQDALSASPQSVGTIFFSSEKSGHQDVLSIDVATGALTNITNHLANSGYPRVSPDGRQIAFATDREGNWQIYLANPDGTIQSNLAQNYGNDGYMDWRSDGLKLVFASIRDGYSSNKIYVINADGSGLTQLTFDQAETVHPVWSPDGRSIMFSSESSGNRQLYSMNSDGSGITRLTFNRGYDDYASWSPNGTQVAFASDRDSQDSTRLEIYVMNADGSGVRRLTFDASDHRHPTWSPDGSSIAFVSNRDVSRDLYIMSNDGSNLKKVTAAPGNVDHPHWKSFPADSVSELASNGGFEDGLAHWLTPSWGQSPSPWLSSFSHGGTSAVCLGNSLSEQENSGHSAIYQWIDLPLNGGAPLLSFWSYGWSADSSTDYDGQVVRLYDDQGNALTTLMQILDTSSHWTRRTFDLSPYRGKRLTVLFEVYQDGASDPTGMCIDDVSITSHRADGRGAQVIVSASPPTVAAASDGYWYYTLTLTNTSDVAVSLTGLFGGDNDYSDQIANWFGSFRLMPKSTLSAGLRSWNYNAPYDLAWRISGTDDNAHDGQSWGGIVRLLP